jgi:hypothetical protein
LPKQENLSLGQFTTVPRVDRILDDSTGIPATSIVAGKQYRIEGSLFGQDNGTISLGTLTTRGVSKYVKWSQINFTDIVSWNSQQILFTPSQNFDVSGGLKVSNRANASNILQLAATVSSSSWVSSSAATASSSIIAPFTDVGADHPYAPAIDWAKKQGILQGYPDGTFRPDKTVNRAQFLKIVLAARNVDAASAVTPTGFKDVDEQAWYAPFVRYAKQQGIIQGYQDGTFKPEQTVNFAEALKMAYVALAISTPDVGPQWYSRYLNDAQSRKILFSNAVDLTSGMSRKDVVWIVRKLLNPE